MQCDNAFATERPIPEPPGAEPPGPPFVSPSGFAVGIPLSGVMLSLVFTVSAFAFWRSVQEQSCIATYDKSRR